MTRIEDLSESEFMQLQAEYGEDLPICPICTLEDVRNVLLMLVSGDAVSGEAQTALEQILYLVTGALVTDRTFAEQNHGSAHLGGDDDDDASSPSRPT